MHWSSFLSSLIALMIILDGVSIRAVIVPFLRGFCCCYFWFCVCEFPTLTLYSFGFGDFAAEAIVLGFQHYLTMLGTTVLIPTLIFRNIGGNAVRSSFTSS
jgi:hypothetical protein